ncbi:hypothetical protein SAMN05444008_109103 [Cnuella takakiae]|uniref:Uncharacterized protein n=1 Tax=Cnuella takakiae TaxID=1302690 RepID=A0A1M5CJM5_9BACT|nr:hypothetical protein BUE76_08020 [Cnuella takakiae]SHF54923.1 hypothetical protein SAMN05444008_109103 [Cnuella takakiae]
MGKHLLQLFLRVTTFLIGILLVTIGLSLIIMPAPSPTFEIATLIYFNPNDGVTIMDLISLLVIFVGIYLIIHVMINH